MGIALIGEQVKSLRIECTGRPPVHFYRKAGCVLLSLALGMAPLCTAEAAPAPALTAAANSAPVLAAQGIDAFYRARGGAPLWLSATAGDSAEQLISLLSTANLD